MGAPHALRWTAHRSVRLSTAASASVDLTAKQTECSEDAWLIMMTLTPASRTVVKMALAVPCTPTMPVPCTAARKRSGMAHQEKQKFDACKMEAGLALSCPCTLGHGETSRCKAYEEYMASNK